MTPLPVLTDDLLLTALTCRYKAYQKLRAVAGESSDYERLQTRLTAEYRLTAQQEMLGACRSASAVMNPSSLADAIRCRPLLILDATIVDANESCRLDALERIDDGTYAPVVFSPHRQVRETNRQRLAFGAAILGRIQGTIPDRGRVVHGPQFKSTRVKLPVLAGMVRDAVDQVHALRQSATPPPLLLNRHCPECEFRQSCRADAVEKDDLSLLRGLSPKEIAGLHRRGIFTATQFSYTFRPARLKRAARKHDHSLQALAVREKKVFVARRPELREAAVRVYLDVEGLPDRDFYYLIGLTIDDTVGRRHLSLWAERETDESAIWAAFLEAVRGLGEDFVLFHYGSYETHFLRQMAARHGGDAALLARITERAVNVLSAIHGRVYFPVHANDLKGVAGSLGFRWSAPDASGLQAIVWRHAWEAERDDGQKERLVTYTREDCSALAVVATTLRSLANESLPTESQPGLPVVEAARVAGPTPWKYGQTGFALPEFAGITKAAYFDYQRDKVLCRTNPAVKASLRRKERAKTPTYRVNQEVQCDRPKVCPQCGSTRLDRFQRCHKLMIDLKPSATGIKRWVTRYSAVRYRCPQCWGTCLPEDYLALTSKYGPGIESYVAYATIAERRTHDGLGESLRDVFGIGLGRGYVGKIRQRAVERYRPTYEGLVTALRKGSLVHADETRAGLKGSKGGYVWVFASPDTAVYVYAPTREGTTVAETLKGFKGVLVSDFYAAYDAVECPQQKCLVHLIRDLNDDLLHHPFDEELKKLATRFTAVLQPAIATIDRFGLKKHHLGKHRTETKQYFTVESGADYRSEVARHYQSRVLKYRDKLFTFLDHDGVPWNNNNAENAVKAFASRRKVMGSLFSEGGIRDQLLLLSLYQTLRYRNLSFWKFLLSGETDLAAFTAREGRGPISLAVAPGASRRGRSRRSETVLSPEAQQSPEARPEGTTRVDADHP
jgi:predicted RecB family nuclease